jgi:hypothetical protein
MLGSREAPVLGSGRLGLLRRQGGLAADPSVLRSPHGRFWACSSDGTSIAHVPSPMAWCAETTRYPPCHCIRNPLARPLWSVRTSATVARAAAQTTALNLFASLVTIGCPAACWSVLVTHGARQRRIERITPTPNNCSPAVLAMDSVSSWLDTCLHLKKHNAAIERPHRAASDVCRSREIMKCRGLATMVRPDCVADSMMGNGDFDAGAHE